MSTACGTCHAPIIWAVSESGKPAPFDAEPNPDGRFQLTPEGEVVRAKYVGALITGEDKRHTSHFATCADGAKHRKPKRKRAAS